MATNVNYATTDTALEALVLHTLPDFGKDGNGIINNNMLLSYLESKGRTDVKEGGLEFWHGVIDTENSNFQWQSNTAAMSANLQNPMKRLRWDIKTFTGSIVINKLHEAQNKGRAMIKDWAKTLRKQADSTIKNQFNSAFWKLVPGANEPSSVPSLISATPTTGTIGGQNRSGNTELQNGAYTTALADLSADAGIAILNEQRLKYSIAANDMVDLIVMGENLYAGLVGYLVGQNRYRPNEKMGELGFETIKMGAATISYENRTVAGGANSISTKYVYGINSNYMSFDLLRDGNFIWSDTFERVNQTLSKALYFWAFCNLTTSLPKAHFVMTDVSTT